MIETKIPFSKLRVGFDLRFLQSSFRNSPNGGLGGVGVYIQGLWKSLVRLYPEVKFIGLIDHGNIPDRLHELISLATHGSTMGFGFAGKGRLVQRFDRSGYSWVARALESEVGLCVPSLNKLVDVLHITNQSPAPRVSCPSLMTIYDLCPLGAGEANQQLSIPESLRRRYLSLLGRSDRLICISEATRTDAERFLNVTRSKTEVVYPGINLDVFHPTKTLDDGISSKFNLKKNYFMHVGVCAGRKNPGGLLQAMKGAVDSFAGEFDLAFIGPYHVNSAAQQNILALAKNLGIDHRVVIVGDVSDHDLADLYRGSRGLVYPSLYEGFGYPAAEALACGVPCVVSDTSSLPEVVGDLGIVVAPTNSQAIAEAMLSLLTETKSNRAKSEGPSWSSRFSWELAAKHYMQAYLELVAKSSQRSED